MDSAAALEIAARRMLAESGFAVGRVDGTMLARARERQLAPLRNTVEPLHATGEADPTWLVTNCRVLSEGVDLPAVDLVVFADAKSSHVDILQCMGRASRLAPGKQYGHVLVPISEEGSGRYDGMVEVMRAYAEQDEEFREGLAALVSGEAKAGRPLEPEEWPEALQRVLALDASSVQPLVAGRLVATVARELVDRWERMYGLLEAYVEREGDAHVPQGHLEGGEALGRWVNAQRKRYAARGWSEAKRKAKGTRAGAMSDEEVRRLEAVGMAWDVFAERWERMYGLLEAYVEREGDAHVPQGHLEKGEALGSWVGTQRERYAARGWSEAERKAKGRRASAMSDEEVRRLEAVGMVWRVR